MSLFSRTILIITTTLLLVGTAAFFFTANEKRTFQGPRVALLLPAVHPSMHQIEQGFISTLSQELPTVIIDRYNANGDKVLMKGQVEKITNDRYDLIFTVGTNASQLTKTALVKKHKTTPLLFAAVSDPVKRGIVDPENPEDAVSGIVDSHNCEDQIDMLLLAKPNTKNILLVYDPSCNPALEEEKNKLVSSCAKRGITLSSVSIFALKELQQKVPALLGNNDVVMTLTDHTLCSGMDSLIKICNQHGVTLFTSELDSNDKGAALSYGVHEREYGSEAAQKATAILKEKIPAYNVPITPLKNFYLKVNSTTAPLQQVILSSTLEENPRVIITKKEKA
jgi:putative ABC transport system substrate-binding protein